MSINEAISGTLSNILIVTLHACIFPVPCLLQITMGGVTIEVCNEVSRTVIIMSHCVACIKLQQFAII